MLKFILKAILRILYWAWSIVGLALSIVLLPISATIFLHYYFKHQKQMGK